MRKAMLLLIINFALLFSTAKATIHFVKHGQGNIPPYLTWENAADSIQWAINVSQFGDTIYVANGVYKEQVVMIPGLSLIGSGMDSCVIDTRDFISSFPFYSVEIKDSCLLKGFKIVVTNAPNPYNEQSGVGDSGTIGSIVTVNRITNSYVGIAILNVDTSKICNLFVYKNFIDDVPQGIFMFNSNAIIRDNTIYTSTNSEYEGEAINIGGYYFNNRPLIDSNFITINKISGGFGAMMYGIWKDYGTRPTIRNNTIILNGPGSYGIELSYYSDSAFINNNLIYAKESNGFGISNGGTQYLKIVNNYIIGNFNSSQEYVLTIGPDNIVKNNVVTGAKRGVEAFGTSGLVYKFNNVWNNAVNYSGFTPDSTNLSVDPMIMDDDSTQGDLDFHLQKYSPLIDRGDPTIKDKDSSRSDIGLYGGPYGESYLYQDIAPRPPINFSAVVDSNGVFLNWNRNTEADIANYNVYRDTTRNFTIDSTKKIVSTADTFYTDIIPQGAKLIVYKVTAVDKQGNESRPSEEKDIVLTGVKGKPVIINNYILYQNYPNPFNPTTKIGYRLKEDGYVKLYVYDIKGSLVETLVNGYQSSGYHVVKFNGEGRPEMITVKNSFASGIYIYQIMVRNDKGIPAFSDVKKMVLLK